MNRILVSISGKKVVKFDFSGTRKIVNVTYEPATKAKLLPCEFINFVMSQSEVCQCNKTFYGPTPNDGISKGNHCYGDSWKVFVSSGAESNNTLNASLFWNRNLRLGCLYPKNPVNTRTSSLNNVSSRFRYSTELIKINRTNLNIFRGLDNLCRLQFINKDPFLAFFLDTSPPHRHAEAFCYHLTWRLPDRKRHYSTGSFLSKSNKDN